MTKLLVCAIAATCLMGGCASLDTAGTPSTSSAAKTSKEDYVTGSRLPRSESYENFQGTKSITRQDYEEYKASTSLKGGN